MTYKTPTEIFKKVSENLQNKGIDVDYETSKTFNKFLFRKVNNMLSSFEHLEVYLPKLGYFKFRKKKAIERLSEIENKEKQIAAMSLPENLEGALEKYHARVARIKDLIQRHEEMLDDKKVFKQQIDEHYNRDISESQEDMGRIEE